MDANRTVVHTKIPVPDVVAHQAAHSEPLSISHAQGREADIRAMTGLNHALNKKVIMQFDRLICFLLLTSS